MFIERIKKRNPGLIKAAIELHQAGDISPNSWVVDLDAIAHNAKVLYNEAKKYKLVTYLMTKQYSRNPVITGIAIKNGLYKTVAVNIQGAKILHFYKIPIGHIGHLEQIPDKDINFVLSNIRPEVITVFSVEKAEKISKEAKKIGITQDLLIRVMGPDDIFFEGQEGGIIESELPNKVKEIIKFKNVRVVGVVSFPCIRYNPTPDIPVEPTQNFHTILRSAKILEKIGIEIRQINAPGNTSSETFKLLAEWGATHVEPGHGLLGTTPNHAFKENLPEIPAYVYLTEVSHFVNKDAYVFGGGFFSDIYDPSIPFRALVGKNFEEAFGNEVESISKKMIIDYHGVLKNCRGRCEIGDSVVFAFRTQMQMTRSQIVLISGISSNKPKLECIFNSGGYMIDKNFNIISPMEAFDIIKSIVNKY